jgi:hypothetical protein
VLTVSVSGFHGYLHRRKRPDLEVSLRADLRTIHAGSRGTYGRPRMVQALRARAHWVGHKRVARLMREEGLHGKAKGRFIPRTTDSGHNKPVAENRLDRQFAVGSPVRAWVSDITYIPTRQSWLYLAVVIELRTRQVLGYSLSERMPDDLVRQAFLNAYSVSPVGAGVLFHSDRGSQYASRNFGKTLTGVAARANGLKWYAKPTDKGDLRSPMWIPAPVRAGGRLYAGMTSGLGLRGFLMRRAYIGCFMDSAPCDFAQGDTRRMTGFWVFARMVKRHANVKDFVDSRLPSKRVACLF